MSLAETPRALACPGCATLPPQTKTRITGAGETLILSLPAIHCAACIATVENGLRARPDIGDARVNLARRQVRITHDPRTPPEDLIDHLGRLGIAARLLDADALGQTSDPVGRALLLRIAIAGFAMMNVMLMSVAVWSGADEATRTMFHLISAAITLPTILYSGQPFFGNAGAALRAGRLNMDVPISLALILASAMSLYETFAGGHAAYFDAALSLTFFLLCGRYLDHRCRAAARSAARELAALEVPRVIRETQRGRETVNLSEARIGDRLVVLPGARIPVDGLVAEGSGSLDCALLTGESLPVTAEPGMTVSAGALNLETPLIIRATAVGEDTTLRRMVTMIDAAESARNRYTALADRAAQVYAPLVHLLALAAFLGWTLGSGDVRLALNIAIATLIVTCPCALGLAVPAVSTAAAGRLFREGLLVKNGTALERIAGTDLVVFDKTGTLTENQLALDGHNGWRERDLGVALALTRNSSHPVSRAIGRGLDAAGATAARVEQIREMPGSGIAARWNGYAVRLGTAAFCGTTDIDATGAWLRIGAEVPRHITLDATLRAGVEDSVAALRSRGIEIRLLSGDSHAATRAVADRLKITEFRARQSPADKIAYLRECAASGRNVLMVGDGLNDTGALAAAHASLAPASAADAARAASDVVLLGDSLAPLATLIDIACRARRRILENFAIAAVYNALVIPLAMAGFVTPLLAALAMSASSITVLLNAMRLTRRRDP